MRRVRYPWHLIATVGVIAAFGLGCFLNPCGINNDCPYPFTGVSVASDEPLGLDLGGADSAGSVVAFRVQATLKSTGETQREDIFLRHEAAVGYWLPDVDPVQPDRDVGLHWVNTDDACHLTWDVETEFSLLVESTGDSGDATDFETYMFACDVFDPYEPGDPAELWLGWLVDVDCSHIQC